MRMTEGGDRRQTPAVLYGDGAEKAYLFVHGLFGNKYEAERFARVVSGAGYDVLAVDLPEHGGRDDGKKLVPWEVVPQIRAALGWLMKDTPGCRSERRASGHTFPCSRLEPEMSSSKNASRCRRLSTWYR